MSKRSAPIFHFDPLASAAPRIEVVEFSPVQPLPLLGLHAHQFYELVLITQGNGIHDTGGVERLASAEALFLIAPGQTHNVDENCPSLTRETFPLN